MRAARKTRVDHVRHADGVPSKALRSGNIEGHPLPPRLQKQAKARAARKQKVQAIQLRLCTDLLELVRCSREEKDGGGGNSNRGDGKSLGKALSKCGFNE